MSVLAMSALPGLRVVVRAGYSPRTPRFVSLVVAFSHNKDPDTRPRALTFHPLVFQQASARKGRAPQAKAKAVTSNIVSRGSELEQLKKLSHLVLETASVGASTFEELGPQAATVSPSVLLHTLHDNTTADVGALEGAMVYEPCDVDYTGSEDARLECVIDKAFVNLGGMMADRVGGLVSVEIVEDKATALSAEAIVAKARHMRAMFDEINVDASKYLFKIPGTWAGVQAVRTLEAEGVACHVTQVHSLTQAAAFGRAGATAIQVYVGRTQAWYRNHPVHQLSNGLHGSDKAQGVEFVRHVKTTFTNESLDTKIIASSINDRENARALAGVDYMLLSDRVVRTLNDADARDEIDAIGVVARGGDVPEVGEVTRESFEAALGSSPAFEEINAHLELLHKDEEALKAFVKTSVMRND